jgi:hypothetical protein
MKTETKTYTLTQSGSETKGLPSVVGLAAARKAAKAAALAAPRHFVSVFRDGIRIDTYISDNGKTVRAS